MARPPIHPGEILADELQERGVSGVQLARELHIPHNRVYQILAGKRSLTADTALRLGHWLGTGPELWMNLQSSYDLRRTEQEIGEQVRETITRQSLPGEAA
ncbi:MAG: HigA family addiction module antitoxin [Chloroflexota bacterium]|nr:HigA family addiction module antitoxin [Chloroflexota bacterium]